MRSTTAPAVRPMARVAVLLATVVCVLSTTTTAAVSYNTSAYVNSDIAINALAGTAKVVLLVQASPSTFDANAFTSTLYGLYAKADTAITSLSCVSLVNWCGLAVNALDATMSCTQGSANNNNASYTSVYAQVQLCGWAKSSLATPSLADLSSAGVQASLLVSSFPGIYDPDTNSTNTSGSYISTISSNATAFYAVFGVLIGVAVLSMIGFAVCLCVCDSRHANRNRSVIDRALQGARGGKPNGVVSFTEHYNLGTDTAGPTPAPMQSYPTTVRSMGEDGYNSREGPGSREMQDLSGSRNADLNGHNGKVL